MRAILQSLLIIAVTFFYVAGPYLTVEMEHSHEVCGSHGHEHTGHDHGHSHHPHDRGSVPSSGDSDSDSHSHTHEVSLGADTPFTPASHNAFLIGWSGINHPPATSEFIPDGPYFPLIKPPQLG